MDEKWKSVLKSFRVIIFSCEINHLIHMRQNPDQMEIYSSNICVWL